MVSICSSTKASLASSGSCLISIARTMMTILAVQSAGVKRGRNGFCKNKSTEKNPESEEDLLEHRTDGTDAFDTLYIGCEKFPQHDFYGGIFLGGVR